jgi:hypothetical protein
MGNAFAMECQTWYPRDGNWFREDAANRNSNAKTRQRRAIAGNPVSKLVFIQHFNACFTAGKILRNRDPEKIRKLDRTKTSDGDRF